MKIRIAVLAMFALLAASSGVQAGISYSYVGVAQGTVAADSPLTVNLYLQETATSSSSSLIASEQGLYSAGVGLVVTSSSGSGTVSTISSATANGAKEPNGFTGNAAAGVTSGGVGYISETQNNSYNGPGPSGTTTGGSVNTVGTTTTTLVFLGSVAIAVGDAGTSTTFTAESLFDVGTGNSPGGGFNGNTLTAKNGYDVDVTSKSPAYTGADGHGTPFTVAPGGGASVPEPSSMALCGFAISGMAYSAYRRRRNQAAAPVAAA